MLFGDRSCSHPSKISGRADLLPVQPAETDLPESINARVSRLLDYLRKHRCLLVLDNAESLLRSGDSPGYYRKNMKVYAQLLGCMGKHPIKVAGADCREKQSWH